MDTQHTETVVRRLLSDLPRRLPARTRAQIADTLRHRLRANRVHYVPLGGRRRAPGTMQPKVRKVYETLVSEGPLTIVDLGENLGAGFERNTLRFAVQVLRQAGLIESGRLR